MMHLKVMGALGFVGMVSGCATTLKDSADLSLTNSQSEELAALVAKGDVRGFENFFDAHSRSFKDGGESYHGFISKNYLIAKGETCGIICIGKDGYILYATDGGSAEGAPLGYLSQRAKSASDVVGTLQFGRLTAANSGKRKSRKGDEAVPAEESCETGDAALGSACQQLSRGLADNEEPRWLCKGPSQKGESYCTIKVENGRYTLTPSSEDAFMAGLPANLPAEVKQKVSEMVFSAVTKANDALARKKSDADKKALAERTAAASKAKALQDAASAKGKGATHLLFTSVERFRPGIRGTDWRCKEQLDGRYICLGAALCPLDKAEPELEHISAIYSKSCKQEGPQVEKFYLVGDVTQDFPGRYFVRRGEDGQVQNAFGKVQDVATWEVISP